MIESRRWPRPTPGSTCIPPSSGPRWCCVSFMRWSTARSISRLPRVSKMPVMPHMISPSPRRAWEPTRARSPASAREYSAWYCSTIRSRLNRRSTRVRPARPCRRASSG